jgi:acetyl/propionyl-CoA carboxylase alpha subunit
MADTSRVRSDDLQARGLGFVRENAIKRMQRALGEYEVAGIRTTIPFFKALLNDVEFQSGSLDTGIIARFMERHRSDYRPDSREDSGLTPEQAVAAMVAAISRQAKLCRRLQRATADGETVEARFRNRWPHA